MLFVCRRKRKKTRKPKTPTLAVTENDCDDQNTVSRVNYTVLDGMRWNERRCSDKQSLSNVPTVDTCTIFSPLV